MAKHNPLLVNIWGGDISLNDRDSHEGLKVYMDNLCSELNLKYCFVKSNCRELFNQHRISKHLAFILPPSQNHGWWASIAHIITMTGIVAPVLYSHKISTHYIGSSYDSKSKTFDANNDLLVHAIRLSGCTFSPVDSNKSRCEKIKQIVTTFNKNHIELKVCWYRKASENCCHCEKCYRTILDIKSNFADPCDFGFRVTDTTYRDIHEYLNRNYVNSGYWNEIIDAFSVHKDIWKDDSNLSWILDYKINSMTAKIYYLIDICRRLFMK